MGARVVALVVTAAVLVAACSGGGGDDDAEGEAFIPPSTTEAPSDPHSIGPMPGPVSGEWTATLDELGTGAGGCVAAVEAGDDDALREAFSHFDAALLHLTNVTNEIP